MLQGPTAQYIVSYDRTQKQKTVTVYHINSSTTLEKIHTYTGIENLVVSQSTRIAILKSHNALVFDSETRRETIITPCRIPHIIAFSPDSQYILIASHTGIIEFYGVVT